MKVIISRKGFDSKYGGCASPIFPNGSMVSLPIPSPRAPARYSQLNFQGRNIGAVVEALTGGRLTRDAPTHLDPDLDSAALPRRHGWRPAFGQTGGQLTHLMNCGVEPGDLFLFFGWFREIEERQDGTLVKARGGQNRQVIFGWLQVESIIDVGADPTEAVCQYPWLSDHPHLSGVWSSKNSVFVGTERLTVPGRPELNALPGGGTFASFSPARCLTQEGQSRRSLWSLPTRFAPQHGEVTLSLHGNPARWTPGADPSSVLLDSAKIGQEFVLESRNRDLLADWVASIFADTNQ